MPEPYSKERLDIKRLKHLAYRLNFPLKELREVAEKADSLYRFWPKRKKNGQFRIISAPKPRLKKIQRAIHKLLREIRVSDCAHCGIMGRSNLTNAKVHGGKEWVFSMDFQDFYPNISHHIVYHLFLKELGCSPAAASLLTRLSTMKGQVPQGGSMSTDIANLVCRRLDERLKGLAANYGIEYTRHNDDLYFSGKQIPESFKKKVKKIIGQGSFTLHPEKESLRGRHQPQIVTGLSVHRKRPRVPREKRRQWRKDEHIFDNFESENLPEVLRVKGEQQIQGRRAYLNYINQTRTENSV